MQSGGSRGMGRGKTSPRTAPERSEACKGGKRQPIEGRRRRRTWKPGGGRATSGGPPEITSGRPGQTQMRPSASATCSACTLMPCMGHTRRRQEGWEVRAVLWGASAAAAKKNPSGGRLRLRRRQEESLAAARSGGGKEKGAAHLAEGGGGHLGAGPLAVKLPAVVSTLHPAVHHCRHCTQGRAGKEAAEKGAPQEGRTNARRPRAHAMSRPAAPRAAALVPPCGEARRHEAVAQPQREAHLRRETAGTRGARIRP